MHARTRACSTRGGARARTCAPSRPRLPRTLTAPPRAAVCLSFACPLVPLRSLCSFAAGRWVIDSRDDFTAERLANLDDMYKLYRCKVGRRRRPWAGGLGQAQDTQRVRACLRACIRVRVK